MRLLDRAIRRQQIGTKEPVLGQILRVPLLNNVLSESPLEAHPSFLHYAARSQVARQVHAMNPIQAQSLKTECQDCPDCFAGVPAIPERPTNPVTQFGAPVLQCEMQADRAHESLGR